MRATTWSGIAFLLVFALLGCSGDGDPTDAQAGSTTSSGEPDQAIAEAAEFGKSGGLHFLATPTEPVTLTTAEGTDAELTITPAGGMVLIENLTPDRTWMVIPVYYLAVPTTAPCGTPEDALFPDLADAAEKVTALICADDEVVMVWHAPTWAEHRTLAPGDTTTAQIRGEESAITLSPGSVEGQVFYSALTGTGKGPLTWLSSDGSTVPEELSAWTAPVCRVSPGWPTTGCAEAIQ